MMVVVAVLVTWVGSSSALAAFPGSNGMLAVAPRTGTGIVLVNPNGSDEHRICAAGARCATSADPTWSPNGQELMFTDPKVKIVYPDGSCLDCDFGVATAPAFEPSGTEISFVDGQTVLQDGIDRVAKGSVAGGTGTDAVWSSTGKLALVRGGRILAGAPGTLKPIGAGSEPSWSPGGQQIAAVQKGWIVVIALRTGRVRRIVRGSSPAFSPDGTEIAFVAPNHRLMTSAVTGAARPVAVGDIQASTVAWQPVPETRPHSCQAPSGSTVLFRSSAAIVTGDNAEQGFGPGAEQAIMSCLTSNGRERLLAFAGSGNVDDEPAYNFGVLASPYVALLRSDDNDHYGGSSATVQVFNLKTGRQETALGRESTSCPSDCIDDLRDLVIDSAGATAAVTWSTLPTGTLTTPLPELSCAPDGSLCITSALQDYTVFAAASPAGGSSPWKPTTLPGLGGQLELSGSQGLACPTSSFCVAIGASDVWTITQGGAWTASAVPFKPYPVPDLDGVTCPSASLCVTGGTNGKFAVTTDPAAGASAWQVDQLASSDLLSAPVCDPGGTCSLSSSAGVYATTDPAGGPSAWQIAAGAPAYEAESCPTDSFCALITDSDQIATATAPGAAAQPQTVPAFSGGLKDITCPTASFCAAISLGDTLETTTDPAGGVWTASTLPDTNPLEEIDCTSATACVITDARGEVLTSSNPAGGAGAWTSTLVDGNPCNVTTPCSEETIQANGGSGESTAATSTISGTGPYVSDLALSGEVLSWNQNGTPESTTLTP